MVIQRIQFEELHLTAPRPESCAANTLTIRGQEQGDGSPICGALTNYESEDTQPFTWQIGQIVSTTFIRFADFPRQKITIIYVRKDSRLRI